MVSGTFDVLHLIDSSFDGWYLRFFHFLWVQFFILDYFFIRILSLELCHQKFFIRNSSSKILYPSGSLFRINQQEF